MNQFTPAGESDFEFDSDDELFDIIEPASENQSSLVPNNLDLVSSDASFHGDSEKLVQSISPLLANDLQIAIMAGNLEVVKHLLAGCEDPNVTLKSGWTLLMQSAYFCQFLILEHLLALSADANICSATGETALHVACKSNITGSGDTVCSVVKALLDAGANPFAKDLTGRTPVMYAARRNLTDVVSIFIRTDDAEDKLHLQDDKGWTVADWAAVYGHIEILKLLTNFSFVIGPDLPSCSLWPKHVSAYVAEKAIEDSQENGRNSKIATDKGLPKNVPTTDTRFARAEDAASQKALETDSVTNDFSVPVLEMGTAVHSIPLAKELCNLSGYSGIENGGGMKGVNDDPNEKPRLPAMIVRDDLQSDKYEMYGQLELFLLGLDLAQLIPVFKDQDVSFEQLLCLSMDELEKIGVTAFGTRKRVFAAIRECHEKHTTESILPDHTRTPLNVDNLFRMLEGASEQMSYIASCMQYVKQHIDLYPDTLKPAGDTKYDKPPVLSYLDKVGGIKASLYDLAQSFKLLKAQASQLEKAAADPEFKPCGNVVIRRRATTPFVTKVILGFSILATALSCAVRMSSIF